MRLIDADKVKWVFIGNRYGTKAIEYVIDNAPTVKAIPLDKPFCKMAYGDYVCYNRNWLMKHLPMEMDILQGEAIPVEWIEKYLKPFRETYEKIDDDWKPACRAGWVIYVIENMLRDWEKENADL